MKLLLQLLGKGFMTLQNRWHRWQSRFRKLRLLAEGSVSLEHLQLGAGVHFNSPVRLGYGRGRLDIGEKVHLGWHPAPRLGDGALLLQPRVTGASISIGSSTALSNNVSIVAMRGIQIGKRCLIGDLVQIFDCDFHEIQPDHRHDSCGPIEPVTIGDNVWIGSRAMILRGVSIGENSVIAAGSVVTSAIPPNCLAAGVPARVIRDL